MMKETVDQMFVGIGELVSLAEGPERGGVRGEELGKAEVIHGGAIAIRGGRILATGTTEELKRVYESPRTRDLSGLVVLPGFIDSHTHPVFGETREEEFYLRCKGADYVEIAKKGGGILSSVRSLRGVSEEELVSLVAKRLRRFFALGTTCIEGKSGYGLSTEAELKSLRALRKASEKVGLKVSSTFLGAHEVAPEYRKDPEAYVDLLCEEMLEAARPLADSCDAFIESHVFNLAQGRRIFSRAKALGYRIRAHVDELSPLGGTELAVGLGAASADHLLYLSDGGLEALAGSETTAVLLPGTSFFLRKDRYAPGRRLVDAGAIVALATDFNPGSCFTQSLPMIATLASLHFAFSPAESLNAMTRNAAFSLGLDAERGTLHPGKAADFAAFDLPSFAGLGYRFGDNSCVLTVKGGKVVHEVTPWA
jgi:imidazolonepropionase